MKAWSTYRTRFLVNAKQLSTGLTFTDALGRQHSGRKGDYLVESDGVLRIQPRHIFEDVYVPLEASLDETSTQPAQYQPNPPDELRRPPLRSRELPAFPLALTRKLPQPHRDRRPTPGLRSFKPTSH